MTRPFTVVSKAVVDARDDLGRAMRSGDAGRINQAYEALESVDRMARARRAAMHSARIAVAIAEKL